MSKTSKFFLSFATAACISTAALGMQEKIKSIIQPQPKIICLSEVEELINKFHELTLYDGDFSQFPNEVIAKILFNSMHELLGQDCIRIVKLRTVCKRWLGIIVDVNKVAER